MSINARRLQRRYRQQQLNGLGMAIEYWGLIEGTTADQEHRFDDIKETGCQWLRTDAYWYHLEEFRNETRYWAEFDDMLDKARRRGLKVVLVIHTTPEWSRPNATPVTYGPTSAEEQTNYANFCARLVARYGTTIAAYEIWNEQNLDQFWSPTPSASSYTGLLKKAYVAMKAVHPGITILSGGTGGSASDGKDIAADEFIAGMYDAGAKDYCDAVGVHPYTNRDGLMGGELWLAATHIRPLMDARGDANKPIWGTEIGAPTKGNDHRPITEFGQETLLLKAQAYWRAIPNSGPLMWYSLRDRSDKATDIESYFGLIRYDGQRKPAYHMLAEINGVGTTLPRPASYPTKVVSVTQYGAMVDGVTDDTEAFVRAINAVEATGGIITIPGGTMRIILSWRGWITIPSNITVRGLEAWSTISVESPNNNYHELLRIDGENIYIEQLTLTRVGNMYGVMVGIHEARNVWLNRVVIDGRKTSDTSSVFHGIMVSGSAGGISDGLHMIGTTLRQCEFGLLHSSNDTSTLRNVVIEGCLFEDARATDLEFNAPNSIMQNITIENSTFRNNYAQGPGAGWAIGLANVQHVTITGNSITNYLMNGIHIEDRSADVTITKTIFKNTSTRATGYASQLFIISGSHSIVASGNVFDTRLPQTNPIDCVYIGAGGAGFVEPYDIQVTGNTAYLANGSHFTYIEAGTTNIVTSPNTII